MALLFCRACDAWIRAQDDRCPHCDHPNWSAANSCYHFNTVEGWKAHLLDVLFQLVLFVISLLVAGLIGVRL
jgi:hypothetical protein